MQIACYGCQDATPLKACDARDSSASPAVGIGLQNRSVRGSRHYRTKMDSNDHEQLFFNDMCASEALIDRHSMAVAIRQDLMLLVRVIAEA